MNISQPYITIITPCYNEQGTTILFLEQLERVLFTHPFQFHIVVVNDCSTDDTSELLKSFRFTAKHIALHVVDLQLNCGHQKAIYEGLQYARTLESDHFIIMDADGEDDPAVIPGLLAQRDADIVHVVRGKRSESMLFRSFYGIYKVMFRLFSGRQMNYGNYCLINRAILEHAVDRSFIHFAAFLSRQDCEKRYVTADRQKRIGGRSKMGYLKLLQHACNSFAEYGMAAQAMRFLSVKRLPGKR